MAAEDEGHDVGAGREEDEQVLQTGVVAIYLVLSFGFFGAPGEWMSWAVATAQYHGHHRPAAAARDGPERFRAEVLMDDAVLVEPLLGHRPWVSAAVYEDGVRQMLGPGSINEAKNLLGRLREEARLLGLGVRHG